MIKLMWQVAFYGLSAFSFLLSFNAYSQHTEDDGRYIENVFNNSTRKSDVIYGENFNDFSGKKEKLRLRLFEPKGDSIGKRPLFILTPGGGFIAHEDHWMDEFGVELAKAGYVVAITRYRLSNGIESPEAFFNALFKSMSDQKAAIRYFVSDAKTKNQYRIDPDNIFIGGHSAGAITSMYTAYLDAEDKILPIALAALKVHGGIEGDSGHAGIPYTIRAVVNLSGLVGDIDMIEAGGPALMSIHGDQDEVVVPGRGPRGGYGSILIHERASFVGLENELHIIKGGTHNDPSDTVRCPECVPLVKRFLFNQLSSGD
ncbi:MAG: poly(3-hydroxybutyrate) depolymerase [Flavobacteriales bacterium]|jgi:poly(3-hydroxybutyrate) depolymerase